MLNKSPKQANISFQNEKIYHGMVYSLLTETVYEIQHIICKGMQTKVKIEY